MESRSELRKESVVHTSYLLECSQLLTELPLRDVHERYISLKWQKYKIFFSRSANSGFLTETLEEYALGGN
jgi:hypothetical protein